MSEAAERAMEEIVLHRAEFLVLLDAMRADAAVGFDSHDLFPVSIDEHRRVVEQGQAMLQERGLLQIAPNGVRALDPLLLIMAATIARPDIALISERDTPGLGRQLFLHYQSGAYVVEQTLPSEQTHRLALLPDEAALFERLLVIFPVAGGPAPQATAELAQEDFLAAKEHAQNDDRGRAEAIFARHGLTSEQAAALVAALAEPTFSGVIAMLRCKDEQIVDARNPALVQGRRSAWMFAQIAPGEPRLRVARINAERFRAQLIAWFDELR